MRTATLLCYRLVRHELQLEGSDCIDFAVRRLDGKTLRHRVARLQCILTHLLESSEGAQLGHAAHLMMLSHDTAAYCQL